MVICCNCKNEMVVSEVGVPAIWNQSHTYFGDKVECPKCKNSVLICNNQPVHITKDEYDMFKNKIDIES